MTHEQRPGFGKGKCMMYYDTVKRQLTQQELDGNFEQLMLRAKRLGAQDMPVTLRNDLTRPLTPRARDTKFQSLELAVKKARYGDGPYPAAEYIFDGATVLPVGITFSRSGTATYIKNGRILTAGVDEPVFEDGGFRVWTSVTNLFSEGTLKILPTYLPPPDLEAINSDLGGGFRVHISEGGDYRVYFRGGAPDIVEGEVYTCAVLVKGDGVEELKSELFYFPSGSNTSNSSPTRTIKVEDYTWLIYTATATQDGLSGTFGYRLIGRTLPETEFLYVGIYEGEPSYPVIVPTNGQPETMPADYASIRGTAFQQIFNPQEGAVVFDVSNSWVSGASAEFLNIYDAAEDPTLGLLVGSSSSGYLRARVFGVYYAFDGADRLYDMPRFKLGFSWNAQEFKFFVNGEHYETVPMFDGWGDSTSLIMSHNNFPSDWHSLLFFKSAPTDEQMEALTNA